MKFYKDMDHKTFAAMLICLHTQNSCWQSYIFRGFNCVSFNDFLKLKLCIPSPKDELLHGLLLLRKVDHDILQKRHLKSLITIANLFDFVISFFSNLLWNPFNITTLLVIYIEDCRSYGSSQRQQVFLKNFAQCILVRNFLNSALVLMTSLYRLAAHWQKLNNFSKVLQSFPNHHNRPSIESLRNNSALKGIVTLSAQTHN